MSKELEQLLPSRLWYYFQEICKVPRPSKKEEKIAEFIVSFGKSQGLETIVDQTGNVLIRKPATPGFESRKSVVLQSHMDMVCEKNSDTLHDFDIDPIQPFIEGEWVKAKGTTLGADDGIGIAAQLALLESSDLQHGPIECLFTVDEETGLTGAFGLKPDLLKSKILLNLDSEDEGEIFIGCAGGKDTLISMNYSKVPVGSGFTGYVVKVSGLKGGHSGDDINKGLGNANKILNRLLWEANRRFEMRLSQFNGGNLRNAIAREAMAIVTVPKRFMAEFEQYVIDFGRTVKNELKVTEPGLNVQFKSTDLPDYLFDVATQERLLNALYACPHGVIAMSADIPNFVETSTNLASVKTFDNKIEITTSQRSSVESAKDNIGNMVVAVFNLAGGKAVHTDGYPGWTPNPRSEILEISKIAYQKLFATEPKVLAIHAGLECGLVGEKYPGMDMISYGPTIKGAHSPDERLKIDTVQKFWDLTLEILLNVPNVENA
ncbi:MAG: aminoacyl-histidine dipeptidase [Lentimicrobiaceae bacterium]|nr:aminoacyl-histidine dipeptidase [Lentimicrobiaceae bacterium]MCO5266146.1 aminoacyl-histidine dipeptidase [Lentimicrobium sp.]HPG33533.1 aminoacyl-histidine dipeptidase [Lentimicrobium sp.]